MDISFAEWILKKNELDKLSQEHFKKKLQHPNKHHPIRPYRGEIFAVEFGINVGFEFNSWSNITERYWEYFSKYNNYYPYYRL